jgi:hypothetical protein
LHRDGEDADPALAAPPTYELPLHCKAKEKQRTFGVTKALYSTWADAYPLVDVRAELREIKAWLVSNPAKRPRSDMARFVNAWLKRTQNEKAGKAAANARASPGYAKSWQQRESEANKQALEKYLEKQGNGQSGISAGA